MATDLRVVAVLVSQLGLVMALRREAFPKNFHMTRPVGRGMIRSVNHEAH